MKASVKRNGKMVEKTAGSGQAAKKEEKPKLLKVKTGMKYRGARESWYNMLLKHDGKTADEFLEACKERPPSLTKKEEAEPPQGWLRFFQRTGVASFQ